MEITNNPVYFNPRKEDNFFRKKYNTTVAFAAGVLLFLLPFAELRCTGYTLAHNTGLGLALGMEWKSSAMSDMKNLMDAAPGKETEKDQLKKGMKESPNIFAIAAIVAGIAGLLFAVARGKSAPLVQMSAGILAVVMLVALLIQLKMQLKSQLGSGKKDNGFASSEAISSIITLRFTIWYYVSLLSFAAAAFFGYKYHRIELDDALRNAHNFDFQKSEPPVVDTNGDV